MITNKITFWMTRRYFAGQIINKIKINLMKTYRTASDRKLACTIKCRKILK